DVLRPRDLQPNRSRLRSFWGSPRLVDALVLLSAKLILVARQRCRDGESLSSAKARARDACSCIHHRARDLPAFTWPLFPRSVERVDRSVSATERCRSRTGGTSERP